MARTPKIKEIEMEKMIRSLYELFSMIIEEEKYIYTKMISYKKNV